MKHALVSLAVIFSAFTSHCLAMKSVELVSITNRTTVAISYGASGNEKNDILNPNSTKTVSMPLHQDDGTPSKESSYINFSLTTGAPQTQIGSPFAPNRVPFANEGICKIHTFILMYQKPTDKSFDVVFMRYWFRGERYDEQGTNILSENLTDGAKFNLIFEQKEAGNPHSVTYRLALVPSEE